MSDQKVAYRDMLDIIFTDRNKSYGAYQLRRDYPGYVGKALLIGLLLIAFFYALPMILGIVRGALESSKPPTEVVAEMGPPPDIDPNTPPPPPPPPVETPPPPTRTTQKFVPPVVKQDKEVVEEPPQKSIDELKEKDEDIGKENKKGTDDAPPEVIDNPIEEKVVESKKAPEVDNTVYEFVEKAPSFPGGEAELLSYLASNIKYPQLAQESGIQGRVYVQFVVKPDGSISDVKTVRDVGGGCGKEAERVVRSMPKWNPGEQNGRKVAVKYTLPVLFQLKG